MVWAVGDIHGRQDLLAPLLAAVTADLAAATADRKLLIFLGDYVDRGPDSKAVLETLCACADDPAVETVFLRGNHEQKMEEFLSNPDVGPEWCAYGGQQTLESFGLKVPAMSHRADVWNHLSADLHHKVSPRIKAFLTDLAPMFEVGGYFFCHAGARPGVALSLQDDSDLMWIRRSFLNDDAPFERLVVHGHTISDGIHMDHRRIGIDTGAYKSGVLSAIRLEGASRLLLQAIETAPGVVSISCSDPK
ncbi:MAG: serine/threonine protein phosphatase [Brevundimonas sp.]|nr:MAG: serine/threonine protein phosphatase [Brevundimonas sp.]